MRQLLGAAESSAAAARIVDIPVAGNLSGLLGLTANNGVAATWARSDATHALDITITPTWTGAHTFSAGVNAAFVNVTGATVPANGWYLPGANLLAVATNGVQRGTISSAGNWTITGASSGTGLTFNSAATTGALADVSVNRAGSTINAVYAGANISFADTANTCVSVLQNSGGQTELWQYNSSWKQMLVFTATGIMSLPNATLSSAGTAGSAPALPATPQGYLQVKINGTVRNIPFYQ